MIEFPSSYKQFKVYDNSHGKYYMILTDVNILDLLCEVAFYCFMAPARTNMSSVSSLTLSVLPLHHVCINDCNLYWSIEWEIYLRVMF